MYDKSKTISVKLPNGKYLTLTRVTAKSEKKTIAVRRKMLLTLIVDCSGSMGGDIKDVLKMCKKLIRTDMKSGDALQIFRFASEGKEVLVPTLIPEGREEAFVAAREKTLDKEIYASGCTNYGSAIKPYANETLPKVTEDEADIYGDLERVVIILSDGYNNTGLTNAQILQLVEAKIAGKVDRVITIGFGNYPDVEFLKAIKNASGCGIYTHASDAADLSIAMLNFINQTSTSKAHTVPNEMTASDVNYFVGGGKVTVFSKDAKEVRFEDDSVLICSVSDSIPSGSSEAKKMTKEAKTAMYALAGLELENMQVRKALKILNVLQDKRLLDLATISGTLEQYNIATTATWEAAVDETKRYLNGKGTLSKTTKIGQLAICQWLEDNKFQVPGAKPVRYREIGMKAMYPEAGAKIMLSGVEKIVPFTESSETQWIAFKLNDYTANSNNINFNISYAKNIIIREDDRKLFAGATKILKVPTTRAINIIDSAGGNGFAELKVLAPSMDKIEEGIRLGIFAKGSTGLEQTIRWSEFPITVIDWDAEALDSERFAKNILELQQVKMKISAIKDGYKEEKAAAKAPAAKLKLLINDMELEFVPTPEQVEKLKNDYFISLSYTGNWSYNAPWRYSEDLPWNKDVPKAMLDSSATDSNIFNVFDFSVNVKGGVAFESASKNSAVTEYKKNVLVEALKPVETATAENKAAHLKIQLDELKKRQSAILQVLAEDFKIPHVNGKTEFKGATKDGISVDVTDGTQTYTVKAQVIATREYCGPFTK